MWQKKLAPFIEAGEVVAIGVVQEQHPDRTRLYRQWRELDWPIFVDSLNALRIEVVPVPVAIDESGITRKWRAGPVKIEQEFLRVEFESTPIPADYGIAPDPRIKQDSSSPTDTAIRNFYAGDSNLDASIDAWQEALAEASGGGDGWLHFALGATLRRRYESASRRPGDAQAAVQQWGEALARDPNQYIWRRRLQQYGPPLDKPYNFYFWVEQARADLSERGQTPHALVVEPTGSELAPPQRKAGLGGTSLASLAADGPDPEGKIYRDKKTMIQIEPVVTPARVRPGRRVQARIEFRVNPTIGAYWNNEADELRVAIGTGLSPGAASIDQTAGSMQFPNPTEPETQETRTIEFELSVPADAEPGPVEIPAYALYYVCENEGGVCYFLRQDFELAFEIDSEAPTLK